VEELLVALEFQLIRHHMRNVRQHAVRRHDDVAFDAQIRHPAPRVLFRDRLHHAGNRAVADGRSFGVLEDLLVILGQRLRRDFGIILTTLYPPAFSRCSNSGRASAVCLWKSCKRMMPFAELASFFIVTSITCCALRALKSKESRSQRTSRYFGCRDRSPFQADAAAPGSGRTARAKRRRAPI